VDKFKELQQKEASLERKRFEEALFETYPSFVEGLPDVCLERSVLEEIPSPAEEFQPETVLEPVIEPLSEKSQAISSLNRFVEENAKEISESEKSVKLDEVEVIVKPVASKDLMKVCLDIPAPTSFEEIYKDLGKGTLCCKEEKQIGTGLAFTVQEEIEVMFLGDYPKLDPETSQADFFIGDSKQTLDRMISAMKLSSKEFAKNVVVKCIPEKIEFDTFEKFSEACKNKIYSEIYMLKPKIIVTLGSKATGFMLENREQLSKIHGKLYSRSAEFSDGKEVSFAMMPIFHPDYLNINTNMKRTTWDDLQEVMKFIGKI
jgi:uracil-DNA glycosylase